MSTVQISSSGKSTRNSTRRSLNLQRTTRRPRLPVRVCGRWWLQLCAHCARATSASNYKVSCRATSNYTGTATSSSQWLQLTEDPLTISYNKDDYSTETPRLRYAPTSGRFSNGRTARLYLENFSRNELLARAIITPRSGVAAGQKVLYDLSWYFIGTLIRTVSI